MVTIGLHEIQLKVGQIQSVNSMIQELNKNAERLITSMQLPFLIRIPIRRLCCRTRLVFLAPHGTLCADDRFRTLSFPLRGVRRPERDLEERFGK